MSNPVELHFRGDVSEETVLSALYDSESGFEVNPDSTMRSGAGLVICGVVITTAQLVAALWQIHQGNVGLAEARASARAANRTARRPLHIELHLHGAGHVLPVESQEELARAVEKALGPRPDSQ